ncbi:Uncharacterized [Moorella glycerini]|nr:hypothetical protein MOST_03380 [Moorella stamsii]CEP66874.1 Uncharacterized [Moorella glycerini]
MLAIVNSVVLVGLEGQSVRVEVDISNGLPVCESVGQIIYTICVCLTCLISMVGPHIHSSQN